MSGYVALKDGSEWRVWDQEEKVFLREHKTSTWASAHVIAEKLNRNSEHPAPPMAAPPRCPCAEALERVIASHKRLLDGLARIAPSLGMADLSEELGRVLMECRELIGGGEGG